MAEIDVADENILKLKQIQHVIQEDGIESSMDETLARVLDFYRKFVPYNYRTIKVRGPETSAFFSFFLSTIWCQR